MEDKRRMLPSSNMFRCYTNEEVRLRPGAEGAIPVKMAFEYEAERQLLPQ